MTPPTLKQVSMRQRRIDKDLHMVMQFYSLKETARHTVGVYRLVLVYRSHKQNWLSE